MVRKRIKFNSPNNKAKKIPEKKTRIKTISKNNKLEKEKKTKKLKKKLTKFTKLQLNYIKHYLDNPGITQYDAYKLAGGKSQGKAGDVSAHKIHNIPHVLERINKGIEARKENVQKKGIVTFEKVIQGLWNIADFNIQDLFDDDNNLKSVKKIEKIKAKAIATLEHGYIPEVPNSKYLKRIRMWDKLKAYELIIKLMRFDEVNKSTEEDAMEFARKIREQADILRNSVPGPPEGEGGES